MNGDGLLFEAEPFELEEAEAWRRPGGPPRGRPPLRPRPRPRGRRWGWPGVIVAPPGPSREPAPGCETVLVLEGFAADQTGLASHHGPMLQRLAAALSGLPQRPQSIEVDARTAGGKADRRAEAAARFLRTRLRGIEIVTLSSRTRGPDRLEVRVCFPAGE